MEVDLAMSACPSVRLSIALQTSLSVLEIFWWNFAHMLLHTNKLERAE